jgi:hypothetical protein
MRGYPLSHGGGVIVDKEGNLSLGPLTVLKEGSEITAAATLLSLGADAQVVVKGGIMQLSEGTAIGLGCNYALSSPISDPRLVLSYLTTPSVVVDGPRSALSWEGGCLGTLDAPWRTAFLGPAGLNVGAVGVTDRSNELRLSPAWPNYPSEKEEAWRSVLTTSGKSANLAVILEQSVHSGQGTEEGIVARDPLGASGPSSAMVISSRPVSSEVIIRLNDRTFRFSSDPEGPVRCGEMDEKGVVMVLMTLPTTHPRIDMFVSRRNNGIFELSHTDILGNVESKASVILVEIDTHVDQVVAFTTFTNAELSTDSAFLACYGTQILLVLDVTATIASNVRFERHELTENGSHILTDSGELELMKTESGIDYRTLIISRPWPRADVGGGGWARQISGPGSVSLSVSLTGLTSSPPVFSLLAETGSRGREDVDEDERPWTLFDTSNLTQVSNDALLPLATEPRAARILVASVDYGNGEILWARRVIGGIYGLFSGGCIAVHRLTTATPVTVHHLEGEEPVWTVPELHPTSHCRDVVIISIDENTGDVRSSSLCSIFSSSSETFVSKEVIVSLEGSVVLFNLSDPIGAGVHVVAPFTSSGQETVSSVTHVPTYGRGALVAACFDPIDGKLNWTNIFTIDGAGVRGICGLISGGRKTKSDDVIGVLTGFADAHPLAKASVCDSYGAKRILPLVFGGGRSIRKQRWHGVISWMLLRGTGAFAGPIHQESLSMLEGSLSDTEQGTVISPVSSISRALVLDGGISGNVTISSDDMVIVEASKFICDGVARFGGGVSTFDEDVRVGGDTVVGGSFALEGNLDIWRDSWVKGARGMDVAHDGVLLVGGATSNLLASNLLHFPYEETARYYGKAQYGIVLHADPDVASMNSLLEVPWVYTDVIESRDRDLGLRMELDRESDSIRFFSGDGGGVQRLGVDRGGVFIGSDPGNPNRRLPLTVSGAVPSGAFVTSFIGSGSNFLDFSGACVGGAGDSGAQSLLMFAGGAAADARRGIVQAVDTFRGTPNRLDLNPDGGCVFANGVPVQTASDRRLKVDLCPIMNARETLRRLAPRTYRKWHTLAEAREGGVDGTIPEHMESGFVAQDVFCRAPELRHLVVLADDADPSRASDSLYEDDVVWGTGAAGLNYIGLIPYIVKSLQEQDDAIRRQECLIQSLVRVLKQEAYDNLSELT